MPYCDVFIANVNDGSCVWDEETMVKKWRGNLPRRVSPLAGPHSVFFSLLHKIQNKVYYGKQLDWGAYAAIVTKKEIEDFIEECGEVGVKPEFKMFVTTLDPHNMYFLVASET